MNDNTELKITHDIKRTEDATGTVWLANGDRLLIRTVVTNVLEVPSKIDKDGNKYYEIFSQTKVTIKPRRD